MGVPAVVALDCPPLKLGGCSATLWRWEDHEPFEPGETARELGAMIRQLHEAGRPNLDLPQWDGFELISRHLEVVASTGILPSADLRVLQASRDDLERRWREVASSGGEIAVHGDLHLGNVLRTPRGLVLADLETFAVGPPEIDLVPVMVGVRRFGMPVGVLDDLLSGYGWSSGDDDEKRLEVACLIRALLTTSWLASVRPDDPEVDVRLEFWRTGDTSTTWRAA